VIDIKEYIDSGVLELYVYGTLTEVESFEVSRLVALYPELKAEVERIETVLLQLSSAVAPDTSSHFEAIQKRIYKEGTDGVIPLSRKPIQQISKRTILISSLGWVAAILLLVVIGYQYAAKQQLEDKIVDIQREQILQEGKIQMAEEGLENTTKLLDILRNRDIITVPLDAQDIAPKAYASVYWDKDAGKVYVDVQGLPTPPEGKVYQLWSLTLDPLIPTNMGVLDQYDAKGMQLFAIDNPNDSEAFGITLEPTGGSDTPTLEQLYTLGVVES